MPDASFPLRSSKFFNGYALLVGVSEYYAINSLPRTVLDDVDTLHNVLADPALCAYPKIQIRVLKEDDATAANILTALSWLAQVTDANDTVMIYFSGHGGRVKRGNNVTGYLLPVDAMYDNYEATAISSDIFSHYLRQIQSRKVAVFLDCCHAGGIGVPKSAALKKGLDEAALESLYQGKGRVIIASSGADELSWILDGAANSLFTKHLAEGLRGGAADENGHVRILNLFDFVQRRVNTERPDQHPILKTELEHNFAVAIARKDIHPLSDVKELSIIGVEADSLSQEARLVIAQLFAGHERLRIMSVFNRGWSGAQVLEIRPFLPNQSKPLAHRVVKIDSAAKIEDEWKRYEAVIKDRIPKVAGPMTAPSFAGEWGGLLYPMAGEGLFRIKSLGEQFSELPTDKLEGVVSAWLFPALDRLWAGGREDYEYSVREGFASWLGSSLEDDFARVKALFKTALEPLDPMQERIALSDTVTLLNPLPHLDQLLDHTIDVKVGPIHGDLNPENIMLIESQNELDVRLIDFARAEAEQFVLHDVLCLETGVLVNLLPKLLANDPQPQTQLAELLVTLHRQQLETNTAVSIHHDLQKAFHFLTVLRRFASKHLLHYGRWENYYLGLVLYLIGVVRYQSLDDPHHELPRRLAFWGACIAYQLRENAGLFDDTLVREETIDTIAFRNLLTSVVGIRELDLIVATAGVNPEVIPGILDGSSLQLRAMYIVQYFQRRGWLGKLLKAAQKERHDINWRQVIKT